MWHATLCVACPCSTSVWCMCGGGGRGPPTGRVSHRHLACEACVSYWPSSLITYITKSFTPSKIIAIFIKWIDGLVWDTIQIQSLNEQNIVVSILVITFILCAFGNDIIKINYTSLFKKIIFSYYVIKTNTNLGSKCYILSKKQFFSIFLLRKGTKILT